MALGGLPKEVHRFLLSLEKMSDRQVKIYSWDPDDVDVIEVEVSPNEGPYEGGKFIFEIKMGKNFPRDPPEVYCMTPIYHPNVDIDSDDDGDVRTCTHRRHSICLNMFDDDSWQKGYGLDGALQGILFLLHNPNVEDALSSLFQGETDEDTFEENVYRSLLGEVVEDIQFPVNLHGDNAKLIPQPAPEAKNNFISQKCAECNDKHFADSGGEKVNVHKDDNVVQCVTKFLHNEEHEKKQRCVVL